MISDRFHDVFGMAVAAGFRPLAEGEWQDEYGRWFVEVSMENDYSRIFVRTRGDTILGAHTRLADEIKRLMS